MGKHNFHALFDDDTFRKFQTNISKGNVTSKLEEFMNNYNAQASGNLNDINIELLAIEINRLRNEKMKLDSSLKVKEDTMVEIKAIQAERMEEELRAEKQRIEDSQKCIQCSKILQEGMKTHKFTKGLVCHSCFLNGNKDSFTRWS